MSILRGLRGTAEVAPSVAELQAQEQRIANGMKAFAEAGDALAKIRDARLYREKYPSWPSYLNERWGMTQAQADRLMSAAQVVTEIAAAGLEPPQREYHARQLTGVPEGQRAEVWQEVRKSVSDPDSITAEQVDAIASKYRSAKTKKGRFRKPKAVKLSGKGWKLELSRKTADVDVAAVLREALAQWESRSRAAA